MKFDFQGSKTVQSGQERWQLLLVVEEKHRLRHTDKETVKIGNLQPERQTAEGKIYFCLLSVLILTPIHHIFLYPSPLLFATKFFWMAITG